MSSTVEIGEKDSVAQPADQQAATRDTRHECPECSGRLIADDVETYCRQCGLVVHRQEIELAVDPAAHGPRRDGPQEWAVEPTTEFRVDNGLGTRMDLGTDGKGNPLSTEKRRRLGRMRKFHRRMESRERRLADGLRDVENVSSNLGLPKWVGGDACRLLRQASAQRLPGGRMAWESLAAGAVMLAARDRGFGREPARVAHYAKASEERACAAARKIRIECELVGQVPPVRDAVVDTVLEGLDDQLATDEVLEYARISRLLMQVADEEPVGPGTTRVTVAASAIYAADRLTDGKALTHAGVVEAASRVCPTTQSKIATYSREVHDAYRARYGQVAPTTVLARTRDGGLGR